MAIERGNNKIILMAIIVLLFSTSVNAAIYYVDFGSGDNSRNGLSTVNAWKNIPGTRNAGDSAYVTASGWPSGKIQAGDIIYLKSGTTHSNTTGGKVFMTSSHYATNATVSNPITIMRDITWGTGSVSFDGAGMTTGGGGFGIIHTQVGGIKINGVTTDGIVVMNSANNGFSHWPAADTEASSLYYMKFYNNGTSYTSEAASAADIVIHRTINGGFIDHVNIDGNGSFINGTVFGESNLAAVGYIISNTTSSNHSGSNDSGIGFKAYNSQLTFDNCSAYDNYKGWDLGEQNGNGRNITYIVKNSLARNNSFGININNSQGSYAGTVKYYLINNIIRDNSNRGTNIYAGPYILHVVHNVFNNNGWGNPGRVDYNNFGANPDTSSDQMTTVYSYNNIFYKPGGGSNYTDIYWWDTSGNFAFISDYNSWVQRASEYATAWGYYSPSTSSCNFSYGANGPGHSSGNWYNWYGCDSSAASNGHYHADSHSKGTGATDSTLPPFTDVTNHNYTLTTNYIGTNLSGQSWYIPAMGFDRAGNARISWDIGAYEYAGGGPPPPLTSPP